MPTGGPKEWEKQAQELAETAAELADSLQLPALFEGLSQRVRDVTFVADDALHGFPFAALRHRGCYLCETYAISMAYDRTGYDNSPGRLADAESLAVAVSRGTPDISPLPKAVSEVRKVETWMVDHRVRVTTLVDDSADKDRVLTAWARASLVHIACHGTFEPDRPDASGLVLIPDGRHPQVVRLRDLAQVDMSRLHHVTLSFCWGADNFVLPGRWIVSLPETICRCGAGSVLACLWPIDDDIGEAFSSEFYNQLNSLPRSQALQRVQQACLKNTLVAASGRRTAHPFFWAGYRLHGNPNRLPFARR